MYRIEVNEDSCSGCGQCADACPMHVLTIEKDKAKPEHPDDCMCCQVCETECPCEAIKVYDS